jgi:hypothetical protein
VHCQLRGAYEVNQHLHDHLYAEEVACRARRLLTAVELQAALKLIAFTLNFGVAIIYT